MPLITVADAKAQLNIPSGDTSQDAELSGYIDAVTEVIEHIVGPVIAREVVETHDGGTDVLALRQLPVLSLTSVTEGAVTSTAWSLSSEGLLFRDSGPAPAGRRSVTITYQAGRSSVPPSIAQAAKELVAVNFRSQQGGNYSPFDSGADTPAGAGGDVILGFFVPNRVRQLLAPHEQLAGIA
jgi:hypothetical protein